MRSKRKLSLSVVVPFHRPNEKLISSLKTLLKDGATEIILLAAKKIISNEWISYCMAAIGPPDSKRIIIHWVEAYRSPSFYRNIGTRIANSNIVLFFDDDCHAIPGLVIEHLRQYENNRVGAVAGITEFRPIYNSAFEKALLSSIYMAGFSYAKMQSSIDWAPTSNLSIRRHLILESPFNQDFPTKGGGEDIDICWKIRNKGMEIQGAANAIVQHDIWQPKRAVYSRLFRWGRAETLLMIKYPERIRKKTYKSIINDIRHEKSRSISILLSLYLFDLFYKSGILYEAVAKKRCDLISKRIDFSIVLTDK